MKRSALTVLLSIATAAAAGVSRAQPAAPPPPATAPVPPPYVLEMPPGYQKIAVGEHTVLCLPADAEWVKKALAETKPATRPTTMPTDLLKRVADNRAAVVKQMVSDLALADDKQPNRLFD